MYWIVFLNGYLKSNNMLLYATGTKDKAFKDSTWEMSVNEVERASDKQLIEAKGFSCYFASIEFESVKQRVLCYQDDDVYLFGTKGEVVYVFFDNRLFKYELSIPVYGYSDVSKLLEQLEQRFGEEFSQEINPNPYKEHTQNYIREWSTEKQKVKFNLNLPSKHQLQDKDYEFEGKENSDSARVYLEVTYLPMLRKIQDEIEVEESSYF